MTQALEIESIPYPSILTVYQRDPKTHHRTLLPGQWAHPAFGVLADIRWDWYEKVDGTNIRVIVPPGGAFEVRGRTDDAQVPPHLAKQIHAMLPVPLLAESYPDGGTLYGEGYGAKIQKGGGNYIAHSCSFCLFDVRIGGVWLERFNVRDIAGKLGLLCPPQVGSGTLYEAVAMAMGGFPSTMCQDVKQVGFKAEGLIMRPPVDLFDRRGDRIIAKIKHKDFSP